MKAERVLFVSNLFPSATEPGRGRFNLDQLRALREAGLDATVVAPRPWFPALRSRSTTWAPLPPAREKIEGFEVFQPRAVYVPRWKGALNGRLYGRSVSSACRAATRDFGPDFLWVSFAFPDAVGAAAVARRLRLRLVVSAVGSDVNVSFQMRWRRRAMLATFRRAACVFTKSARMRGVLVESGVDPARVFVVYNGVDHNTFRPRPRESACRELGLDPRARRLLFVGNLVEIKGLPDLLEAIPILARTHAAPLELVLVGDGPFEPAARARAGALGIGSQVRFAGRHPHERVALWLAASDALVLPSLNEGLPAVVLEALACGRPVVATAVGGVAEVHPGESAGALVPPHGSAALAAALGAVTSRSWDEQALTALVARFSWEENARATLQILREVD